MPKSGQIKRISRKGLFKYLFVGIGGSLGAFMAFCGVLAAFGIPAVKMDGEPLIGIAGLVYGFLYGLGVAFSIALISIIFAPIGWALLGRFFSDPQIFQIEAAENEDGT